MCVCMCKVCKVCKVCVIVNVCMRAWMCMHARGCPFGNIFLLCVCVCVCACVCACTCSYNCNPQDVLLAVGACNYWPLQSTDGWPLIENQQDNLKQPRCKHPHKRTSTRGAKKCAKEENTSNNSNSSNRNNSNNRKHRSDCCTWSHSTWSHSAHGAIAHMEP